MYNMTYIYVRERTDSKTITRTRRRTSVRMTWTCIVRDDVTAYDRTLGDGFQNNTFEQKASDVIINNPS